MLIGIVTVVTNIMTSNRPVKGTPECVAVMTEGLEAGTDQNEGI